MTQKKITYTYVFVRKDLPIHAQIIQAGHALHEVGFTQTRPDAACHLVLFEVSSEKELLKIHSDLMRRGIWLELFFEPDYNGGEYTAMASACISEGDLARASFAKYKLYESINIAA